MPYIEITTSGRTLGTDEKSRLIAETTRLMHDVMRKKRELISVRLEDGDTAAWGIGGAPMAEGQVAAHMELKVTQATNTPGEKAAMIEAGHALLREVVGAIPEATYVIVNEIPLENWGYGGVVMAERYAAR